MVDGLMRAMWTETTAGTVYNLGNPEEHSVLDWANTIIRLCGSASKVVYESKRQDDPERRRPNIEKAERELGWVPRVDPETGLQRTVEWFRVELERDASCLSVNVG
jgi:nucleoside-diphosphate-sugar epimerase